MPYITEFVDPLYKRGDPDRDYMPFFVNKSVAQYNGKIMYFINLDNTLTRESHISAKNITINKEILYDVMKLKTKTHDNDYAYTSSNDNGKAIGETLAIAQLRDSLIQGSTHFNNNI